MQTKRCRGNPKLPLCRASFPALPQLCSLGWEAGGGRAAGPGQALAPRAGPPGAAPGTQRRRTDILESCGQGTAGRRGEGRRRKHLRLQQSAAGEAGPEEPRRRGRRCGPGEGGRRGGRPALVIQPTQRPPSPLRTAVGAMMPPAQCTYIARTAAVLHRVGAGWPAAGGRKTASPPGRGGSHTPAGSEEEEGLRLSAPPAGNFAPACEAARALLSPRPSALPLLQLLSEAPRLTPRPGQSAVPAPGASLGAIGQASASSRCEPPARASQPQPPLPPTFDLLFLMQLGSPRVVELLHPDIFPVKPPITVTGLRSHGSQDSRILAGGKDPSQI